jgi:hypothetical protein
MAEVRELQSRSIAEYQPGSLDRSCEKHRTSSSLRMTLGILHPDLCEILNHLYVQDLCTMRQDGHSVRAVIVKTLEQFLHRHSEASTVSDRIVGRGHPAATTDLAKDMQQELPSLAAAPTPERSEVHTATGHERFTHSPVQR